MFFFFVGGLDERVRGVLKAGAGKCIFCGSSADLVDHEKVVQPFFIPLWRWPAKEPVMHCNNCNLFFPQSHSLPPAPPCRESVPAQAAEIMRCRYCGRAVEPDFSFCPFCGVAL